MYFYEIHEGDDELGTAVLLGHDRRIDPNEFFAMVKKARALVLGSFEEDSLAEAIANELQRSSGFVHITDDLLVASVNVDESKQHTYLVSEGAEERTILLSRDDDSESPNGEKDLES